MQASVQHTPQTSVQTHHTAARKTHRAHKKRTRTVHKTVTVKAPTPAHVASSVKRELPAAAVKPASVAGSVHAASSGSMRRLTLITLIVLAAFSLGLASVPLSTLRRPGAVPLALRMRPILGAVGVSLLGAVAVIYLLGGKLGA